MVQVSYEKISPYYCAIKYVYRTTIMSFSMHKYLCIIINVQKHICLCTYSFLCIKILRGHNFIRGVNISPWNIHPGVKISWGWIFNPTPVTGEITMTLIYQYRRHFWPARSTWSMDLWSTRNSFAAYYFMKFCLIWEGLSLPHDMKFHNNRDKIADRTMIFT